MFGPPEMVPYSKIDEKELERPEHGAMARKPANESMVQLKNDGVVPLKSGTSKIAVGDPHGSPFVSPLALPCSLSLIHGCRQPLSRGDSKRIASWGLARRAPSNSAPTRSEPR